MLGSVKVCYLQLAHWSPWMIQKTGGVIGPIILDLSGLVWPVCMRLYEHVFQL